MEIYLNVTIEGGDPKGVDSVGISLVDISARVLQNELGYVPVSSGACDEQWEDALACDFEVEIGISSST